jgi:arabinosaccharide transport system substrate-binding protein
MEFPYGKALLAILIVALLSGGVLLGTSLSQHAQPKPDLIMACFDKDHGEIYRRALPAFEQANHCKVQIQVVDQRALQNRLESAMEAGAPVPDMVEIIDGTLGIFTKGPLADVGFRDLTERVRAEGLDKRLVSSRFAKWSSRGHVFALPHDVHPVMLCYRRDLCEQLGIDVNSLTTWDEFARVGRQITKDYDGDGVIDHYMIDLPADGADALRLMLLQRGGSLLDKNGEASFDSPEALEVVLWYLHATHGKNRFSFPCGWGQPLAKAVSEGLCLFYICPDWRTMQFQSDLPPEMSGKLAIMPLPAWREGGLRTSTWGGTGLAFPKTCRNFELAWKLAMYLYYDPKQLGPRFRRMNILPPLREVWNLPEITEPRPYYSNQPIGKMFVALAPLVPEETVTAYLKDARDKFGEAYTSAAVYFDENGDAGLREYVQSELKRCADQVRRQIHRNVFINPTTEATAQ